MTPQTVIARSLPLPTELGGVRISITDSAGVTRDAALFFASPEQINYLIPAEAALGIATITLTTAAGLSFPDLIEITQISPSLFSANSDGQGAAAAVVLRIGADGRQRFEPNQGQVIRSRAQPSIRILRCDHLNTANDKGDEIP